MERIKVSDKYFRVYIKNEELMARIDAVAEELNRDYASCTEPPVLLCTLNGAIPFAAELMKRLNFDHKLVCVKLSSYMGGLQSTGNVTRLGPTANVAGQNVIVVEDIVDTGITLIELRNFLKELGASEVKVCSMLMKPKTLIKRVPKEQFPEYVAMEVPDKFIVGFGLDYDELGRNYKDIYVLDE